MSLRCISSTLKFLLLECRLKQNRYGGKSGRGRYLIPNKASIRFYRKVKNYVFIIYFKIVYFRSEYNFLVW